LLRLRRCGRQDQCHEDQEEKSKLRQIKALLRACVTRKKKLSARLETSGDQREEIKRFKFLAGIVLPYLMIKIASESAEIQGSSAD
jgi:hypothetical protein